MLPNMINLYQYLEIESKILCGFKSQNLHNIKQKEIVAFCNIVKSKNWWNVFVTNEYKNVGR